MKPSNSLGYVLDTALDYFWQLTKTEQAATAKSIEAFTCFVLDYVDSVGMAILDDHSRLLYGEPACEVDSPGIHEALRRVRQA